MSAPLAVLARSAAGALRGAARVALRAAEARAALARSAQRSGLALRALAVDARGAPLPQEGVHWSLTHGGAFVAGVAARCAVGIDLERVRLPRPAVVAAAADEEELALAGGPPALAFARAWTAKEAVLKLAGCGLGELSRARLAGRLSAELVVVRHRGRARRVRLAEREGHVAALALEDEGLLEGARFALEALGPSPLGALA